MTSLRTLSVSLALLLVPLPVPASAAGGKTAHDFTFEAIEGGPLPLSKFSGKVLLVVNTASFCGFTHQYAGLQKLWEDYRSKGLVVVGVPSNDFGGQEPGKAAEIKQFCETNYNIDFPLTAKVRVRGAEAHPFYAWAGTEAGADGRPKWNFHKYLIGADGRFAGWFPTRTAPSSKALLDAVEGELSRAAKRQ